MASVETSSSEQVANGSTHPLPSGEFPLIVHFDVLRRFMAKSRNGVESVTATSVEGEGLPEHAAQSNARFLCDVGLLVEEAAGKYKPTPVAMQFINTQVTSDERARKVLQSLVAKTWFGLTATNLLRATPAARREELAETLAMNAGGSGRWIGNEISVLVEYLGYTGLFVGHDQGHTQGADPAVSKGAERAGNPQSLQARAPGQTHAAPPVAAAEAGSSGWELVQTNDFELRIRASPTAVRRLRKQLDLLEEKLKGSHTPRR